MNRLRQINNQDGLTLVELLGSIVILSIIVVAFLGFFIQSARTTKVSGEIIDAAYLAQQQAEEIYNHSNYRSHDELVTYLSSLPEYSHTRNGDKDEFTTTVESYRLNIVTYPVDGDLEDLYTLLIKAYDSDGKQAAQIETKFIFDWSDADDEG